MAKCSVANFLPYDCNNAKSETNEKYSLKDRNDKYNFDDSLIVSRILDKLSRLPEVRRKNRIIDSLTHHSKGISMRVMHQPDKSKNYFWIAVGYNNSLRFETYYNFYVWPDKMIIKYLDPHTGNTLSLAEWRQKQKTKRSR